MLHGALWSNVCVDRSTCDNQWPHWRKPLAASVTRKPAKKMAVTSYCKTQMFASHALKTAKPMMEYCNVNVSEASPIFKSMSKISWSPCERARRKLLPTFEMNRPEFQNAYLYILDYSSRANELCISAHMSTKWRLPGKTVLKHGKANRRSELW